MGLTITQSELVESITAEVFGSASELHLFHCSKYLNFHWALPICVSCLNSFSIQISVAWDSEPSYIAPQVALYKSNCVRRVCCNMRALFQITSIVRRQFTQLRGADGHDHGDDSHRYHLNQNINQDDACVDEVSDVSVQHSVTTIRASPSNVMIGI